MFEWLLELKDNVDHHGIRWGVLFTLYAVYRKELRNRRLDKRDEAIFENQSVIMAQLGVGDRWQSSGQPIGSSLSDVQHFKRLFLSLRKGINRDNQLNPRRMRGKMKILISSTFRKWSYLIIGGAVTSLNTKLGLNLSYDDIIALWGVITVAFHMETHFNLKKFISNFVSALSGSVQAATTTTDGKPITTVIAPPMSYQELLPTINQVHTEIGKAFEQLKSGKYTDASQEAANLYMTVSSYINNKPSNQPTADTKGA